MINFFLPTTNQKVYGQVHLKLGDINTYLFLLKNDTGVISELKSYSLFRIYKVDVREKDIERERKKREKQSKIQNLKTKSKTLRKNRELGVTV